MPRHRGHGSSVQSNRSYQRSPCWCTAAESPSIAILIGCIGTAGQNCGKTSNQETFCSSSTEAAMGNLELHNVIPTTWSAVFP
nr:hypothetical protein CFP56_71905 [Quercus suber]